MNGIGSDLDCYVGYSTRDPSLGCRTGSMVMDFPTGVGWSSPFRIQTSVLTASAVAVPNRLAVQHVMIHRLIREIN
jgi:hypothetical protein